VYIYYPVYYTTVSQSLIQQNTPHALIGRVMSLYTLGVMGTTPLGGLVSGYISDAFDPRAALGLGAASLFACGLFTAVTLRRGAASRPKVGTQRAASGPSSERD
jgi:MFS family permease